MSPAMGRLSSFRRFHPASLKPQSHHSIHTNAAPLLAWATGNPTPAPLITFIRSPGTMPRSPRSSSRIHCSCGAPASGSIPIILTSLVSALTRFLASLLGQIRATPEASSSPLQGGRLGLALLSTSAIAKAHLSPVLLTLKANPTFMSGLLAWMVAQASKVFTTYVVCRRWDLRMLVGSGGMPSSHSALCVGLTTSVALCHGVGDALFPVCLGFTLIVMYDATGVRRHAGMQAEVLNLIIKDLFQGHPVSEKKLKELLGHTPLQVLAGAFVGMVVGYYCSQACSTAV